MIIFIYNYIYLDKLDEQKGDQLRDFYFASLTSYKNFIVLKLFIIRGLALVVAISNHHSSCN
jgi:hypothetical protein